MASEQESRIRVTEYLDLDLDREQWLCNRCGQGSARRGRITRRAACSTTATRGRCIRRWFRVI